MKIHDQDQRRPGNAFDVLVYKRLSGTVVVDGRKAQFDLKLPCYQRLLRLTLRVSLEGEGVRLVVEDQDYEAKRFYFENAAV